MKPANRPFLQQTAKCTMCVKTFKQRNLRENRPNFGNGLENAFAFLNSHVFVQIGPKDIEIKGNIFRFGNFL